MQGSSLLVSNTCFQTKAIHALQASFLKNKQINKKKKKKQNKKQNYLITFSKISVECQLMMKAHQLVAWIHFQTEGQGK